VSKLSELKSITVAVVVIEYQVVIHTLAHTNVVVVGVSQVALPLASLVNTFQTA
jgi:hypothetical protein